MLLRNAVEFSHKSLRLVPKIHNAIDMVFAFSKLLRVIYTEVLEGRYIQDIVYPRAVAVDYAIGNDSLLNDAHQRPLLCIGNHLGVNFASTLQETKYGRFSGCAESTLAFTDAAKVTFVHLDFSRKRGIVGGG